MAGRLAALPLTTPAASWPLAFVVASMRHLPAGLSAGHPATPIPLPSSGFLHHTIASFIAPIIQAAVVGVTCRQDVVELLEKRVKSRFR